MASTDTKPVARSITVMSEAERLAETAERVFPKLATSLANATSLLERLEAAIELLEKTQNKQS